MIRTATLALAALALASVAAAQAAQSPAPSPGAPEATTPAPTQKAAADLDKVVCKPVKTTGSRLGSKKQCATNREWDQLRDDSRRGTERQQSTIGKIG